MTAETPKEARARRMEPCGMFLATYYGKDKATVRDAFLAGAEYEATAAGAREHALARENYGLLLMLQDALGDVGADALRATAESKVRSALEEVNDD